jgi:hypothetical protein
MERIRRWAVPITIISLAVNVLIFVFSSILWVLAWKFNWVDSVAFVSHVSMMALVFSGVTGTAAGLAGMIALVSGDVTKP